MVPAARPVGAFSYEVLRSAQPVTAQEDASVPAVLGRGQHRPLVPSGSRGAVSSSGLALHPDPPCIISIIHHKGAVLRRAVLALPRLVAAPAAAGNTYKAQTATRPPRAGCEGIARTPG